MSVQLPTQALEHAENDALLDWNDDVPSDGPRSEDEVLENLAFDAVGSYMSYDALSGLG